MMLRKLRWLTPCLLLIVACGAYRLVAAGSKDAPAVAITKVEPNYVGPRYNQPLVATDEQLHAVLARMTPPTTPDTNIWVHALRLWGPHAKFDDPKIPSGRTMLLYYLDDNEFLKLAGEDAPPLFTIEPEGIRVREWNYDLDNQRSGSVHPDDLLATMAESGVPLDTVMITRTGEATVGDLLTGAMRRYNRDQHEYEWSSISYARYLFPTLEWRNQFGEKITVDDVVDELIEQRPQNGICRGTHRLEALVVLNRIDEQLGVLPKRTKKKIIAHLQEMSRRLVASQYPDGQWGFNWPDGADALKDDPGKLSEQILATGHHLEWLALAPEEVQPPRETIIRAAQWIARTMVEVDEEELKKWYGPFSHSARALCLWRGQEPYAAWLATMPPKTEPVKTEPAKTETTKPKPAASDTPSQNN